MIFYAGKEIHDHGERRAGVIPTAGLKALGLAESDLEKMRKSVDEKALIAVRIRGETTVPLKWIAEKLRKGTASKVSRVARAMALRLPKERILRRAMRKIDSRISS